MKNQVKKNIVGLAGLAAAAGVLSILLLRKREDGTTIGGNLLKGARKTGADIKTFGEKIKDRLLNHVKGPNGEPVYIDMYDRQFYEDPSGERVYMDTV